MEQLTKEKVNFSRLEVSGHLYKGWYQYGNIAIVAGEDGRIGKLSVNLTNRLYELAENEFFVKLYGEGKYLNDACFNTGLFEKVGEPFHEPGSFESVRFQKWMLKDTD